MKSQLPNTYADTISIENLLEAWREFVRGKRGKPDVQIFSLHLMDNILSVRADLANHTYQHGPYKAFNISDPKPRRIHKATVRDRLLHHAIYRVLYPFFDRTFIADSFSCRNNKGTHKALNRFRAFAYQVSKNHTRTAWVLKCDIKKFFENIDHEILKDILARYIPDQDILWLCSAVIDSFSVSHNSYVRTNYEILGMHSAVGLPLGNLTSQLFVNVYMSEFDRFVKHTLKAKHYIRYSDDFILLRADREFLRAQIPRIQRFLKDKLKLTLHPDKVLLTTIASGVDFLGWVHFLDHRVLRTATKRRMLARLSNHRTLETTASYRGLLKHGNTYRIRKDTFVDSRLRRAGVTICNS